MAQGVPHRRLADARKRSDVTDEQSAAPVCHHLASYDSKGSLLRDRETRRKPDRKSARCSPPPPPFDRRRRPGSRPPSPRGRRWWCGSARIDQPRQGLGVGLPDLPASDGAPKRLRDIGQPTPGRCLDGTPHLVHDHGLVPYGPRMRSKHDFSVQELVFPLDAWGRRVADGELQSGPSGHLDFTALLFGESGAVVVQGSIPRR